MSELNNLKHYFTQPNRFHNPYTLVYVNEQGDTISEQAAKELFEEYPDDDEKYQEVTLQEQFGVTCAITGEVLEPDCGYPTSFLEFVEKLLFQGWCLESAQSFARDHIDDDFLFEEASQYLMDFVLKSDLEFPDCALHVQHLFDLDHEDMEKVKELYDEEDAKQSLKS